MGKLIERFFIDTPVPTNRKGTGDNSHCTIYLEQHTSRELLWSADFPLPKVGSRVFINMNHIGWAEVKGYFESDTQHGAYLGVMTKATNPPAWLKAQQRDTAKDMSKPQWMRDGIGCEFGTEIRLSNPNDKRRKVKAGG